MALSPLAGKPAPADILIDTAKLQSAYYENKPDMAESSQRVSFGTSGHRGNPFASTFTEQHILAITQAICEYRQSKGIDGPIYVGKDTHAASDPAQRTAVEVLAGNGVHVIIHQHDRATPTPVVSHVILTYNRGRTDHLADGIVITPSHNPPQDGGFKYNPPNGGPADTDVTGQIQDRANELLRSGLAGVNRIPFEQAIHSSSTEQADLIRPYVEDLKHVIDIDAIRNHGMKLAADPLGGSALDYWLAIRDTYGLDLEVVNPTLDPTFKFMRVDHDGKIRMDCSSPWAMAGLVDMTDKFPLAFANDPDADRHGIVVRGHGLMNPNHFLAVSIAYLIGHRPEWPVDATVGKTLVSSSLIDRVVLGQNRSLMEVPVGFKWFSSGLYSGTTCFGGEESAGASFLRHDGTVWTTDKDGIIMGLLAAEICARTDRNPAEHLKTLTDSYGMPHYKRIDAAATPEQKSRLKALAPDDVAATTLAGEEIVAKLTAAPGNHASIGGLKVVTNNGWFAARPSGTEDVYKIYAESFISEEHLDLIIREAKEIVSKAL